MTKQKNFGTNTSLAVVFATLLVAFTGVTASLQANVATAQQDMAAALEEGHKKMEAKIKTKDKDIPVAATGVDTRTNTLVVVIDDGKADKPKAVYEEKVKAEVGDIPFKVGFGHLILTDCTSKTTDCTMPMVGGVQIATQVGSESRGSTLMLSGTRTNGQAGFIMTAHSAGWGSVGNDIGQATNNRKVGDIVVNPAASGGTRASDAAFSDLDAGMSISTDRLYRTSTGGTYTVDECLGRNEIVGNEEVRLHGYTRSGLVSGYIIGTNWSLGHPNGTLVRQYMTSGAVPNHGDSGGALTSVPSNNIVDLYGQAVGYLPIDGTNYGIYSAWNEIQAELGLNDC